MSYAANIRLKWYYLEWLHGEHQFSFIDWLTLTILGTFHFSVSKALSSDDEIVQMLGRYAKRYT